MKVIRWLWAALSWALAIGAALSALRVDPGQAGGFLFVAAVLLVNGLLTRPSGSQ